MFRRRNINSTVFIYTANQSGTVNQNNQSNFKASFKLTNHIAGIWKTKKPLFGKFGYKLCDFKMDLIKWKLNFGSCNFGLKSYLWFQIAHKISDQIALHSVQLPLWIVLHSVQLLLLIRKLYSAAGWLRSIMIIIIKIIIFIKCISIFSPPVCYFCLPVLYLRENKL